MKVVTEITFSEVSNLDCPEPWEVDRESFAILASQFPEFTSQNGVFRATFQGEDQRMSEVYKSIIALGYKVPKSRQEFGIPGFISVRKRREWNFEDFNFYDFFIMTASKQIGEYKIKKDTTILIESEPTANPNVGAGYLAPFAELIAVNSTVKNLISSWNIPGVEFVKVETSKEPVDLWIITSGSTMPPILNELYDLRSKSMAQDSSNFPCIASDGLFAPPQLRYSENDLASFNGINKTHEMLSRSKSKILIADKDFKNLAEENQLGFEWAPVKVESSISSNLPT